jgi:hypothetical protein
MRTCEKCAVVLDRFGSCPYCTGSIEALKMSTYSLARDGDGRESRWAPTLTKGCPSYEAFWKTHIVPLTFRIYRPENNLVRPEIAGHLVDLADGSYSSMFHLTQCHLYGQTRGPITTENLYCFFSHGTSLMDALTYFAAAVSTLTRHHGAREPFSVKMSEDDQPPRPRFIQWWVDRDAYVRYQRVGRELRRYRNVMVHQRPVFIQKGQIPKYDSLDAWCGLSAKARIDRDPAVLGQHFEPASETFARILAAVGAVLNSVFTVASDSLDPVWSQVSAYRDAQRYRTS